MLHTIVPYDVIFPYKTPETEEETMGTARLVWQKVDGERKLSRVISSNLSDYLKYKV